MGIARPSSSSCSGTRGGYARFWRARREATPTISRRKPSSARGSAPATIGGKEVTRPGSWGSAGDCSSTSGAPHGASDAAIDADRLLAGLSPPERAALTLCFGHGWSHGEAAEIMAIPLGTLKSLVLRGRAKAQKLIAEGAES
jgi:DNA-directed RNA polymerase specialized sigma24 family protein